MTDFEPNHIVLLPCELNGEHGDRTYSVSIQTGGDAMVGQVSPDTLTAIDEDQIFVRVVVMQVKRRSVRVWIPGSFSNSDGHVDLPRDWAIVHARKEDPRSRVTFPGPMGERKLPPYWGHGWFHQT